ncbi:MAG: arylesterase [Lentisphaeraceae bacterium]|nr:arylesterase [Lentisphaeraceae bacterium]
MKLHNLIVAVFFFSNISLLYAAESTKTILCMGDSLTAGFGLQEDQSYPSLLQKELTEKGINAKILNAGVSGNTSAGGVRRINWYFNRKIDVMLLALGANDGLRGLPVKSTEENLQKIIDEARKKNPDIKIILAGMKVPPNMGDEYSKGFEELFPKLAKKNKLPLIPFLLDKVAGNKKLNLPDGIHPNEEGQKIVAQTVMEYLLKALAD